MVIRKLAGRMVLALGILVSSMALLAPLRANAVPLPGNPFTIADTLGGFVSLYPFGGNPQVDFAPINGGAALLFRLELISNDPIPPDSVNLFISLRLDFGTLGGNLHYANIAGPNLPGTIDHGVFLQGTIQLATTTLWAFALGNNPDPLSMTYFADFSGVPPGVIAVLHIEQTPVPGALALFAGGLGVIGFLGQRRRKRQPA